MKVSIKINNPLQTKEVRHALLEAGCKYVGVDENHVHFVGPKEVVMQVLMLHTR